MRKAMFRMGYDGTIEDKSRATPHGFRASASSVSNEQSFNSDAIERQLSHMERNSVRATYIQHPRYMNERATMMQWWADYLDEATAKAAQIRPLDD
jgi:integrase